MLNAIQTWMEQSYRLEPAGPLQPFLIDHELVLSYLGKRHPLAKAEEVVLLLDEAQDCHLGLYLDPRLLKENEVRLSAHQWMTLVEGVSHLLLLLNRLKSKQEVSQLELELQAEIDKFIFMKFYVPESGAEAKGHLQREADLKKLDPSRKITYETARRLAYRYCLQLENKYLVNRSWDPLWENLRHFYRMSHWEKLRSLGLP